MEAVVNKLPVPTTRYQALGAVWDVPQVGNEIVGFPTVVPDVIDPTSISVPWTGGVLVQGVDVAPVVTAVEVSPVEVAPVEVTPVALPDFDDEVEVLLFCLDVSSTTPSIEDNPDEGNDIDNEESSLAGCKPRYI